MGELTAVPVGADRAIALTSCSAGACPPLGATGRAGDKPPRYRLAGRALGGYRNCCNRATTFAVHLARKIRPLVLAFAPFALVLTTGGLVEAAGPPPALNLQIGQSSVQADPSVGLQALLVLTVLSLAPAILLMTTSFIRIVVVLSFARSALGLPQTPPNQVLIGLALFLTAFIMWPVWQQANADGIQAYLHGEISAQTAIERTSQPLREFMFRQTRQDELALFVKLAHLPPPNDPSEIPTHVLIPAFMLSELKTAFQMGFMILVPFLVIDLVVASLVMSLGMMMLPPTTLSLPFKILLFVLANGWTLVVQSLIQSFH